MLGRAAYQNPAILAEVDGRIYGDAAAPGDWASVIDAMADYAGRHIAAGGRLMHVTRHMVGLFQGLPGARRFRQILSTDAARPGAGPEVLKAAFAAVELGGEVAAA
jgi:tRNA-dihydrouridine synthase A